MAASLLLILITIVAFILFLIGSVLLILGTILWNVVKSINYVCRNIYAKLFGAFWNF